MRKFFLDTYYKKKDLVNYFILTYTDKAISFALPLSILFIVTDKSLYTLIEVAFSYATIALVLIELGLSNYLFRGYKEADDKKVFIENAKDLFRGMLAIYSLITLMICSYLYLNGSEFLILFSLTAVRALFTFYVNFYSNIYRLTDRPSRIYLFTIAVNLSSVLLLIIAYRAGMKNSLLFFYLPSMVLILAFCFRLFSDASRWNFNRFVGLLKKALAFSWPIMANVLAMSFINNYGKIYAFGHLSEAETVQISYILRIGLIVQLGHTAFASYFSKSLFMDQSETFDFKIFRQYALIIFLSILAVVMLILITNSWFGSPIKVPFEVSTFLFLFYIVLWCFVGYLEIYFGVKSANRLILYYSVTSSAVYIFLLKISTNIDLLKLSIFMAVAGIVNIVLVIAGLIRLGVLKK